MNLITNILLQLLGLISIIIITIIAYFVSLFASRLPTIKVLTYSFSLLRTLIFKLLGITVEYRGLENIPKTPCVFASKHQSSIETSFFFNIFKMKTVYAFKKEINDVFLWGTISKKFGGVAIDRAKGSAILEHLVEQTKEYLENGYSVVIFPEGTRTLPKQNIKFKSGIAKIYSEISYPIVPVALNTGLIYPKGAKLLYKKNMIVEFLPPLPFGLAKDEFLSQLQSIINEKSNQLVDESLNNKKPIS